MDGKLDGHAGLLGESKRRHDVTNHDGDARLRAERILAAGDVVTKFGDVREVLRIRDADANRLRRARKTGVGGIEIKATRIGIVGCDKRATKHVNVLERID